MPEIKLNDRITIEKNTASDSTGAVTGADANWTKHADRWANKSFETAGREEKYDENVLQQKQPVTWEMREVEEINPSMRIKWDGDAYNIKWIEGPDENGRITVGTVRTW